MNSKLIAQLTLETWRSATPFGKRTEARRDALCTLYGESYFGPESTWSVDAREAVENARLMLRQNTRIDELTY